MYQIAVTDFSLHAINIKHFKNQYGTVWPTFSVLIVGLYNRRFRISTSTFILLHKCLLAYTSFVDSYLLLTPDTGRQRTPCADESPSSPPTAIEIQYVEL